MNIDFKLEFLYYQKKQILDGEDPKMEEFEPHIKKFQNFLKTKSIKEVIELIVFSYKENYPQDSYFYRKLLVRGAYLIETNYPKELDDEVDSFLTEKEIDRDDIKSVVFKRHDDEENSTYYLKELEINFKNSQDVSFISLAIEKALAGVSFEKVGNSEYIVSNSPISEIAMESNKFTMTINPDKWKIYFGLG